MSTRYQVRHVASGRTLDRTFEFMTMAMLCVSEQSEPSAYMVEPFVLMEALAEAHASGPSSGHD